MIENSSPALVVEHAQVVEVEVGADAAYLVIQVFRQLLVPVAGEDAGDVGAVLEDRAPVAAKVVGHPEQQAEKAPVDVASRRQSLRSVTVHLNRARTSRSRTEIRQLVPRSLSVSSSVSRAAAS